jgi:hypothetical protein
MTQFEQAIQQAAMANTEIITSLDAVVQKTGEFGQSMGSVAANVEASAAPFATVTQAVTEYEGVLTSSGTAVQTFEATSATLGDTLTSIGTGFTDTTAASEGLNTSVTTLEPSMRTLDQGVQDSTGSLTTYNTLVNDVSTSTETYTGALGNLGTELANTQQKATQTEQSTTGLRESMVSLGAGVTSLVAQGYSLYMSWDNLEKAQLRTEKSSIALDKAFITIDARMAAVSKSMQDNNVTSAASQQAFANLGTAIDTYTALLDQHILSGQEYDAALQAVQASQEAVRQAMLDSGMAVTEVDTVMNKLTLSLDTGYVRAMTEARNQDAEWRAGLQLGLNIMGTFATGVQTTFNVISSWSDVTAAATGALHTFRTVVTAAEVSIAGLTISIKALLASTVIGLGLLALGTLIQYLMSRSAEAQEEIDTLADESLPGLGSAADDTGTAVNTFTTDSLGNLSLKLGTVQGSIAGTTAQFETMKKSFTTQGPVSLDMKQPDFVPQTSGTAAYSDIDKLKASHDALTDSENAGAKAAEAKAAAEANAVAVYKFEHPLLEGLTNQQILNTANLDKNMQALKAKLQVMYEDREVTNEGVIAYAELTDAQKQQTLTSEEYEKKLNEILPTKLAVAQAADAHLQSLVEENKSLIQTAQQMGVSAEATNQFKVSVNEMTNEILNSKEEIYGMNTSLIELEAGSVNVTRAFTDQAIQGRLVAESHLEGSEAAAQYGEQLIKNRETEATYTAGLKEIADTLGLELDPRLEQTSENYKLLLAAVFGNKEELEAYKQQIINSIPEFEKMQQAAESLRGIFDNLVSSFASNRKETMKLFEDLPKSLRHDIKMELKIEEDVAQIKTELQAWTGMLTKTIETEEGTKIVMNKDIEISAKAAQGTIDDLYDKVQEVIDSNPPDVATWQSLFNELAEASTLPAEQARQKLNEILTNPTYNALLRGDMKTKTGEEAVVGGVEEGIEAAKAKLPAALSAALTSEPATLHNGANVVANEVVTQVENEMSGDTRPVKAISDSLTSDKTTLKAGANVVENEIATEIEAKLKQDEKLTKGVADSLTTPTALSNVKTAGEKAGDAYKEGFESRTLTQMINAALLGHEPGSSAKKDKEEYGPPAPKVEGPPAGTQLIRDPEIQNATLGLAKSYDAVVVAASKASAQIQTMLTGITARATIEATKLSTAYTTAFNAIPAAATRGLAGIQTMLTGISARAAIEAPKITASFTTAFNAIPTAATRGLAGVQTMFTGLSARAAMELEKIKTNFESTFSTLPSVATKGIAGVQQMFTGLESRVKITMTNITTAITTAADKWPEDITPGMVSMHEMFDPGFTDIVTTAFETIAETVGTSADKWPELITPGMVSMHQMFDPGLTDKVQTALETISGTFETEGKKWEDTVQTHTDAMAKMFDDLVKKAEETADKINDALDSIEDEDVEINYHENSKPEGMQFGGDFIVEAGSNKLIMVGEGNRRERVTVAPEGSPGFDSAYDFRSTRSRSGQSGNVPVNVTIIETRHDYLDTDRISTKINRRVYKGISGTY